MLRSQMLMLLALVAATASACSAVDEEESDSSEDAIASDGFVPPAEPTQYANRGFSALTFKGFDRAQPSSEKAKSGLDDILEGRGFRNGLPLSSIRAAERIARNAEVVSGLVGRESTAIDTSTPEGKYAVSGKLPSFPGRAVPAGTPLAQSFFQRGGSDFTNSNCFACHAGAVRGQIVAGLGNHDVDQTQALADVEKLMKIQLVLKAEALLRPSIEREELGDFFRNATLTVRPTLKYAETRGDNFGPYAVWKRLSRLKDPVASGLTELSEDERTSSDDLFDATALATVDPNPWWTRKYRKTSYAWGETTANTAAHFAFNFTTPHEAVNTTHAAHVATISNILAFAEQTTSPAFPERLDGVMVKAGAELFHGRRTIKAGGTLGCSGCHGSYTKSHGFEKVSGWEVHADAETVRDVKTDPAYSDIVRKFTPMAERGNGLLAYFTRQGKPELAPQVNVPKGPGYVSPVLVGIWASAPYFHNGSVPTLYGVLNSDARPAIWTRPNDNPFAYSTVRVGLTYTEVTMTSAELAARSAALASKDAASPERVALRAIYDTNRHGRSNKGHTFGDKMTDAERFAVIEFLKSLSGDDMPAR